MIVLFLLLIDSPIIITEVMSNVKGSESTCGDRNEFIEVFNCTLDTIDLASYLLSDLDVVADEIESWDNDSILIKYPHVRINSTLLYPHSYGVILDREYTKADTSGGNSQPYDFPDSTLILTTDDTSLGDGLQNTDPLLLYSLVEACTTTFGTPFLEDNFPDDPGDGISWERIDYDIPDDSGNWHPSIDTAGCTPGQENSTKDAYDLAVVAQSFFFTPSLPRVGENVCITVYVKNLGLRSAEDYTVTFFDDRNCDQAIGESEIIAERSGETVAALDSIRISVVFYQPSTGNHVIGCYVDYAMDRYPTNNLVFKNIEIIDLNERIEPLVLSPVIFTPDMERNNRLRIDYFVPTAGGSMSISIFTMAGVFVHSLCKNKQCLQTAGTLYWDGSTGREKVPSGMYLVYFEYRNQDGIVKVKKPTILAR